jgi:hypothetical protein
MTDFLSHIDSQRFGFNIARIDDVSLLLMPGFITSLQKKDIRLVITRTGIENLASVNQLADRGFRIMDIQSVWRSTHRHGPDNPDKIKDLSIGFATAADVPAFREIAAGSFEGYGHYFADPRLDRTRCREIYPDWAARTLTDPNAADEVIVARLDGKTAGFLSLKIHEKHGNRFAACVMGAVAEAFRGRHIFQAILGGALKWQQQHRLGWTQYNALTGNIPVSRALASCGFRPAEACVTLHGWTDL